MIKTTFETLNWTIYTLSTAQMYEATLQRNYTNSSFAKNSLPWTPRNLFNFSKCI